jgi:chemotaxis protein MotA
MIDTPVARERSIDRATVPGLVIGLGALLVAFLFEGGGLTGLLNAPAAILVFGGTVGAGMVGFSLGSLRRLPKSIAKAFVDRPIEPHQVVETFVHLADRARREGLLSLEDEAPGLDPFLKRGVLLVVDGSDPSLVREIMESEIDAMQRRHQSGYGLLEAMGGYAPTMGIIGTVMGLIHVLSSLENPSELGPAIAVAFTATLYGVASANLVWLPLASKLKQKSAEEVWLRELMLEGLLTVQAGDNPRIVREKLETQLPPESRSDTNPVPLDDLPSAEPAAVLER